MSAPKRVILLGALSTVAESLARIYARQGAHLVLVARNRQRLEGLAADLRLRGAGQVQVVTCDLAAEPRAAVLLDWVSLLGYVDHIILLYGVLGEQAHAEIDEAYARKLLDTNFLSPAIWSLAAARIFEDRRGGSLVVVGSVAGDRGRQSNYIYGAAKGGLAIFIQGIAHRLDRVGARAVIIKPGFIATRMTQHLNPKGPLWASPETVARIIRGAADRGGPIIYAPGFWRLIMLIIRLVPAWLFHRTKL